MYSEYNRISKSKIIFLLTGRDSVKFDNMEIKLQ